MNKLLIFTGGLVTGAVASYFVTKHMLTEKINQEVTMEFREMYENPLEPNEEYVRTEDVVIRDTDTDGVEKDYKDYSNITNEEVVNKPDIIQMVEEEEERLDLNANAIPYLLDESEFLTAYINDKVSLIWYADSETLATEDDSIKDPMSFDMYLGDLFDDTDILYIRDDRVGIDYSIIHDEGSFFDNLDE